MSTSDVRTLLLVSADVPRAEFLADQLTADGFEVVAADGAAMAARALERSYPDVVVVDVDLPDASGLTVLGGLRAGDGITSRVDPGTPLIVLCDADEPLDRVRALDRGADDVLSLPVHYPELLARARAVLRRTETRRREGALHVGPIALDPVSRAVSLGGEPVELSQKEFALLQVLAADPARVFPKEKERLRQGASRLGSLRFRAP